jgi:hypothetical protein
MAHHVLQGWLRPGADPADPKHQWIFRRIPPGALELRLLSANYLQVFRVRMQKNGKRRGFGATAPRNLAIIAVCPG